MVPHILNPTEKYLEVASDSSGLKTNNADEYRSFKYGEKKKNWRKYFKVNITADIKYKKLLNVDAYIEGKRKSELKVAEKHLKKLKKSKKIKKFYGDNVYDTNRIFDVLEKVRYGKYNQDQRQCFHRRCRGSSKRRKEVREYLKKGCEE